MSCRTKKSQLNRGKGYVVKEERDVKVDIKRIIFIIFIWISIGAGNKIAQHISFEFQKQQQEQKFKEILENLDYHWLEEDVIEENIITENIITEEIIN